MALAFLKKSEFDMLRKTLRDGGGVIVLSSPISLSLQLLASLAVSVVKSTTSKLPALAARGLGLRLNLLMSGFLKELARGMGLTLLVLLLGVDGTRL